jgi:uncharacterized membrane-anchored protein YitT (DUF2179 family)
MPLSHAKKQAVHHAMSFFWIVVGAFLAALSIRVFLLPNQLIDGGIVGLALILARLFGDN